MDGVLIGAMSRPIESLCSRHKARILCARFRALLSAHATSKVSGWKARGNGFASALQYNLKLDGLSAPRMDVLSMHRALFEYERCHEHGRSRHVVAEPQPHSFPLLEL
jgi:hypothetical protein